MTRDEWQRAEPILTQALLLPEEERQALIDTAVFEEAMRRELMEMLRRSAVPTDSVALASPSAAPRVSQPSPPRLPVLAPGDALDGGRFVIVRQIGRGGMATVFLAHDTTLGTLVALKVLPSDERLIIEARRAAICSDHPHVATVHNVLRTEFRNQPIGVLVMEYVAGTPASRLLDDGPIELTQALRWARQVASAIAYAHDHQVLHCDLKPGNIIITPDGRAKVLDFGIARAMFDPADPAEPVRGTVPYMAPEQLLARDFSPAGDIYSLGVALFELVTGRRPFSGDEAALRLQILIAPPPRLSELVPGAPPQLEALLERALAKDPDQRFRSARAFERALDEVHDSLRTGSDVGPGATESFPTMPTIRRIGSAAGWGLAALGSIAVSGLFTTVTFNLTFGRTGAFGVESVGRWFEMGLRSIVAPSISIGAGLIAVILLSVLGRLLLALVPPFHRAVSRLRATCRAVARRGGLDHPVLLMQALIGSGAIAIAIFLFAFREFIGAFMSDISTASADELARLDPNNDLEHVLYRRVLELILLVTVVGIVRIQRAARARGVSLSTGLLAAAFAIPAFAFALCEVPYRTVFWSEFPRVDLAETRCYQIGSNGVDVLLHCPDVQPPRNRIISTGDQRLRPRGVVESVFVPAASAMPTDLPEKESQ